MSEKLKARKCPKCEGFGDDPLGCESCDNTGTTRPTVREAVNDDEIEEIVQRVGREGDFAWTCREQLRRELRALLTEKANG